MQLSRIITVLFCGVVVLPAQLAAQRARAAATSDTVLFICEHGTVRSLLATLLFARYANEISLPMTAVSRGTAIDSTVPPWLQQALTADHFTLGTFRPRALAASDVAHARYVVSFDLPSSVSAAARVPHVQWDSLPSVSTNYALGRDAIDARVHRLVDSLFWVRGRR